MRKTKPVAVDPPPVGVSADPRFRLYAQLGERTYLRDGLNQEIAQIQAQLGELNAMAAQAQRRAQPKPADPMPTAPEANA